MRFAFSLLLERVSVKLRQKVTTLKKKEHIRERLKRF